jgi:hemerythrin-like domain-containing protein
MDALEELREMHVEAKDTFAQIQSAGPTDRAGLWAKLRPELELHEQIEEKFVYDPVAREAGPTDEVLARWETEHEQQVEEADAVMAQIGELEPSSPAWLAQVTMLKDTLAQHIAHEENDIWPRIRMAWGQEKLDEAGSKIAAAKAAGKAGATVSEAVGKAMEGLKQMVGQG